MKKILFLLLIAMAAMTGCQSTSSSQTNALPDNGMAPAAPVGGGTKGIQ